MNRVTPILVCELTGTDKDLVVTLLIEAGATAVSERDTAEGATELRAGFGSEDDAAAAVAGLAGMVEARLERVAADDWIASQRSAIESVAAGRFTVRAPWHEPPADLPPGQLPIVIDPGGAFGHGAHPSTAMLLGLLDQVVTTDTTVVDVGTGTGILAIAAALLGARVQAIDIDADALEIARANILRNGVGDRVRLGLAADEPARADVALVNLTIADHRTVAPGLGETPVIAASGILERQYPELLELYAPREVTTAERSADWVTAILA